MSDYDSDSGDSYKPKRRGRFFLYLLVLLLLLAGLAPNIIGWSGQTNAIAKRFVKVDGDLNIGSASLGWFQKITLNNIQLNDSQGESILKVNQIQSSKSLLSLAMNQEDVGEFTIDGADLSLAMTRDSSNLEKAIQPMMETDPEAEATAVPAVVIKLRNSQISVRKDTEDTGSVFEETNATISVHPTENKVLVSLDSKPKNAGTLETNGQIDIDFKNKSQVLSAAGDLIMQDFQLAVLEPVLYRVDPNISVNGELNSRLKANWKNPGGIDLEVEQLRSDRVMVSAKDYLGPKPATLQNLMASGDVHIHGTKIDAQQLALKCDVAVFEAEGKFDSSELLEAFSGQGSISSDFNVNGQVDLVALNQAAPGLISIRDDIEIQQGLVSYTASSRLENGQRRLFASIELPSVAAKRFAVTEVGGQRQIQKEKFDIISIRTPVRLSAATRQAGADSPMWLELLKCESEFLTAQGATQPNGVGSLKANGDLLKLKRQLEQFVDLSSMNLNGQLDLNCQWGKLETDQTGKPLPTPFYRVSGGCTFKDFVFHQENMPPIREEQLDMKFGADYDYESATKNTLRSGGVSMQSGSDFASVALAKPVENPNADSAFLTNVHLEGKLPDWVRRAKAFAWIPKMKLQGNINTDGQMLYTPNHVSFQTSKLAATDFFLGYATIKLREKQLNGQLGGKYDFATEKFISETTTLVGETVKLHAKETVIDLASVPQGDFFVSNIDLQTSVQRLMVVIGAANAPCPYRGAAQATLRLAMKDDDVKMALNGIVNEFQYLSITPATPQQQASSTPMWTEKEIGLAANCSYNLPGDLMQIESAQVIGDAIQLEGKGQISALTTACDFNLAGVLQTDASKLGASVKELFGLDIQLAGKDQGDFSINGPFFPEVQSVGNAQLPVQTVATRVSPKDEFNIQAQLKWEQGSIYGLPFGASTIGTRLTTERVDFNPIKLVLSRGNISVKPAIHFKTDETLLTFQKEKIVDHAQLSPEICSQWLKYVAPMLADATAARGDFSVDLKQNAVLPVSNPLMGQLDCDIILHNAEVGLGPLGRELVSVVDQIRAIVKGKSIGDALINGLSPQAAAQQNQTQTWLRMPEQTVGCRVVNGRVYHQDLYFSVKDVVVTTTGSVGADQSIDIVATIPIRKEWVEKNKMLGMVGDSIKIPIKGSLTKPSIGREALKELPKMLMQNAAGNFVQDKAGEFLKDSAGKLIGDNAGDLLKGLQLPSGTNTPQGQGNNPLQDAAGKLMEDQMRKGFNNLFGPKK